MGLCISLASFHTAARANNTLLMVLDINPTLGASSASFDPNPSVIIGSRRHRAFNPIAVGNSFFS